MAGLAQAGKADPSQLPAIDAEIFPAYLGGLAEEDHDADPAQVRAGYIGSLAARSALCAIPFEQLASMRPTASNEAMLVQRLQLTRLLLEMARETTPA